MHECCGNGATCGGRCYLGRAVVWQLRTYPFGPMTNAAMQVILSVDGTKVFPTTLQQGRSVHMRKHTKMQVARNMCSRQPDPTIEAGQALYLQPRAAECPKPPFAATYGRESAHMYTALIAAIVGRKQLRNQLRSCPSHTGVCLPPRRHRLAPPACDGRPTFHRQPRFPGSAAACRYLSQHAALHPCHPICHESKQAKNWMVSVSAETLQSCPEQQCAPAGLIVWQQHWIKIQHATAELYSGRQPGPGPCTHIEAVSRCVSRLPPSAVELCAQNVLLQWNTVCMTLPSG
eukprot:361204-Chlamydomonas_euryale.AAC.2